MIKFEEVKDKIIKKLNALDLPEDLALVDGFVNQPLADVLNEVVIGASVVPMVLAVGKKTKQIYYFSYNALEIQHG